MKNIILLFILAFFSNCTAQKKGNIQPPLAKVKQPVIAGTQYNIVFEKKDFWNNEDIVLKKIPDYKNISAIKKNYSLKKGKLYYKKKLADSIEIYYLINPQTMYVSKIRNGIPIEQIINVEDNPQPSMYNIKYYDNGDILFKYLNKESFLANGSGYLKIYNYGFWDGKNQKYIEGSIKEEGEVKNNFKFGEWKYYNKEDKIDSIKTYTLKDSVDIRFPHCIFNKNEPCY